MNGLLLLGILVLCLLGAPAGAQTSWTLRPEEISVQKLEPGSRHSHSIQLTADRPWYAQLEQRGIDATLTVKDPGGEVVVVVDSPFDRRGREVALIEPEVTGLYAIEIHAQEALAAAGRYALRVDPLGDEKPGDGGLRDAAFAATEGGRLYWQDSPDSRRRASAAYARAFVLWNESGNRPEAARALYADAVIHRLLGKHPEALELSRRSLALWRAENSQIFAANAWNEIGLNQWHLGERSEARAAFNKAHAAHGRADHEWGVAVVSANLCVMDLVEGALREAAECSEEVAKRLDQVRELDAATTALSNAGRAYDLLGEPDNALSSYTKALELSRVIDDPLKQAQTLGHLGEQLQNRGDYPEALTHLKAALALYRRLEDRPKQAATLHDLGITYEYLGGLEPSSESYEQALALWRQLDDPRGTAATSADLGRVYLQLRRLGSARDAFQPALELWRQVGDRREEALALADLGRCALKLRDPTKAAALLEQAFNALQKLGDRQHQASTLTDLGAAYGAVGQTTEARRILKRALKLAQDLELARDEARVFQELARIELKERQPAAAQSLLDTAIQLLERNRPGILAPILRPSYGHARHRPFEPATDLLLAKGDTDGAFEMTERSRARALLELLQRAGADIRQGDDRELIAERRRLQIQLNAKKWRAVRANESLALRETFEADKRLILRRLANVEAELRRGPSADQPKPWAPIDEIRSRLDDDEVLLVLTLGATRSRLWRLDGDGLGVHDLPGRARIERAARRFHKSLSGHDPADRGVDADIGRELSQLLLEPLKDLVHAESRIRRWIIVPDGALFYVPFEALPLPGKTGTPVLERFEVTYLPSASALVRLGPADQKSGPAKPVFVADPGFDGPASEVDLIAEWADGADGADGQILTPRRLEARYPTILGDRLRLYSHIQFATPAFIDSQTPALSGLRLRGSEGDPAEELLGLRDIYALGLDAELVVLSRSRAQLGNPMRGEGLSGLTQGFFSAGAQRVFIGLWPVDDRAMAELMKRFYRAMWRDGQRPAAALRTAKLSLRTETPWRDPYFWASSTLRGNPN